jgi:squalene-hopene/tetraprenyl-beta-curcumene cyclase
LEWLKGNQNGDGGWGGDGKTSSVEETALAVEALLAAEQALPRAAIDNPYQAAAHKGLTWLLEAVETNNAGRCSPIGFYFAKLWYYERLYPTIFAVSALREAAMLAVSEEKPVEEIPADRAAAGELAAALV